MDTFLTVVSYLRWHIVITVAVLAVAAWAVLKLDRIEHRKRNRSNVID